MAERKHISLKVKLAAALLQMKRCERTLTGERWTLVIPHEEAKTLTPDQIIARFHFDHYPIPHAQDGPDEPWNLTPAPIAGHQEKTAKVDIPQIAKTKRISKDHEEFRRRMLTPRDERTPKQSRWGKRPFQRKP